MRFMVKNSWTSKGCIFAARAGKMGGEQLWILACLSLKNVSLVPKIINAAWAGKGRSKMRRDRNAIYGQELLDRQVAAANGKGCIFAARRAGKMGGEQFWI
jgi:hypothetical protein